MTTTSDAMFRAGVAWARAEAVLRPVEPPSHGEGGDDAAAGQPEAGKPLGYLHARRAARRAVNLMVERPDSGTPRCPCGCFQTWCDEVHDWACPHCDGVPESEEVSSKRGESR